MRDKNTAAFLSLLFGWSGIHQFYLRRPGLGLVFIGVWAIFGFATAAVLGFLNAVILFLMSTESFDKNYNRGASSRRRPGARKRYPERRRTDFDRQRRTNMRQKNIPPPKKKNPYKATGIKKHKEFDLEGAVEDFQKALEIEPNDVATHFNIACSYSLLEKADKSFQHLDKAVSLGFKDFEKIKKHDNLAFVRIQPEFEEFESNGFRIEKEEEKEETPVPSQEETGKEDLLLEQLNKLKNLREKGFITEEEFVLEKRKLMNL
jgi:TM2 domain-containing membrane protein YozV